jgi:16S rRNA processing protein RimM
LSNPESPIPESQRIDWIVLATVVRPHGLKGEVKLYLSCSGLDRLKNCPSLTLMRDGKVLKKVTVGRAFLHNDGDAVVRLLEVEGVEEAESLRGAVLAVPEADRAPLNVDEFYVSDLMGLKVETSTGEPLGIVEEVMDETANAILVVRREGKEILLPVLKTVVKRVDLQAKVVVADPMEEIDAETAD